MTVKGPRPIVSDVAANKYPVRRSTVGHVCLTHFSSVRGTVTRDLHMIRFTSETSTFADFLKGDDFVQVQL